MDIRQYKGLRVCLWLTQISCVIVSEQWKLAAHIT